MQYISSYSSITGFQISKTLFFVSHEPTDKLELNQVIKLKNPKNLTIISMENTFGNQATFITSSLNKKEAMSDVKKFCEGFPSVLIDKEHPNASCYDDYYVDKCYCLQQKEEK